MIRETREGITLAVRAQPGAKKTAITGLYGEGADAQLKIAVHAPPLEGRANQALIAFLADYFSLPRTSVELISGELSRSKVFLLRGVTQQQVESFVANRNVWSAAVLQAKNDEDKLGLRECIRPLLE